MRNGILAPLRHHSFRLLFSGQVVSDLGDWLDFLALIALIVYRWELGAGALAALSIALALPRVLLGPVAGVLVDRWSRKSVMVVSDLARAVLVLGLMVAPNLATVLVLVFLKGLFSSFFGPAKQATIPVVVPEDDLLPANSLSQLSAQGMKVIGPVLGGALVAALGPRPVFALDAVSFLISAAFLALLPSLASRPEESGEEAQEASFWAEFRAGLSYMLQRRTLTLAIGSMSAALFMIFIIDSLGVLALRELGFGEALFGLAIGSIGLGTTAGALTIGQWGKRFHPFGIMGLGQAVSGIGVALIGVAVVLATQGTGLGWVLVYMVIGFAAAAVFVPYGYILQVETPRALMGRVFATADGVQTTFQLLAPPLGAALSEVWGIGPVFAVAGGLLALLGLLVFLIRPQVGAVSETTDSELTVTAA